LQADKSLKMLSSIGKVKNISKHVKRPKTKIAKKSHRNGVEGMATDELFAEEFQDEQTKNIELTVKRKRRIMQIF